MKYLISDTHLFHFNIIQYGERPFFNIIEMNKQLIENWNNTVNYDDMIIHLGDFGFGNFQTLSEIVKNLNGYKILIIGNHDKRNGGVSYWKRIGFNDVYNHPIIMDDEIILSHAPVAEEILNKYKFNYHGHLHQKNMDNPKYKNFSVEQINYKPFAIEFTELNINRPF